MRTTILAILLGSASFLIADPVAPSFPRSITVEGADCRAADALKWRVLNDPESLSGKYWSDSITDGSQFLRLKVHQKKDATWLADGTLETRYGHDPVEVVT